MMFLCDRYCAEDSPCVVPWMLSTHLHGKDYCSCFTDEKPLQLATELTIEPSFEP